MALPALSIRKPVMAVMISLFFILVGIISFVFIPIQETPNITYPVISITTNMPGGSPSIINQMITKPIESQINAINGLQEVSSQSTPGKSVVDMTFKLGTNMGLTYAQVESKLNEISNEMPGDAKKSIISESKSNASPIIFLSLHGSASILDMDQYARTIIQKSLQNISGVANVKIVGVSKEAVNITLNLEKMAAMKITAEEVRQAFKSQHVNMPGGNIKSGKKQYTLDLDLEAHNLNQLKDLIVAYRDKAPIYLRDVADVSFGLANKESVAYYNGQPSIGITITKKLSGNVVSIADNIETRVKNKILPTLPNNMTLTTIYNQASYIKATVHRLEDDIWVSIIAAAIIILLFLKSLRSTIIIICSIPVSLFAAVGVAYAFGFTLNTITLLAMIILVGVVVDDSIVVLENIYRYIKKGGKSCLEATKDGANEVVFPVFASSITLVCIFLPIVFVSSTISMLFKSFGIVITGGIIISLIVSLTLVPVFCSRFVKATPEYHGVALFLEKGFICIDRFYKSLLHLALKFRWIVIVLAVFLVAAAIPATYFINKGFMPAETHTGYFTITVQPPQGLSVNYTEARVNELADVLNKTKGIAHYFSSMGPGNLATVSVRLTPLGTRIQETIMNSLRKETKNLAGALFFVQQPNNPTVMTFQVRGPNYKNVIDSSFKLLSVLEKHQKDLGDTYIQFSPSQPSYKVNLEHNLSNSLGITPSQVANAMAFLSDEGVRIGHFSRNSNGERYDVLMKTKLGQFTNPSDMSKIYLSGKKSSFVRLDTIASLERTLAPSKITRTNLEYSIGFTTLPNLSTNKAASLVQQLAKPLLKKGYTVNLTGKAASLKATEKSLIFVIIIILLLMYMVLASQFNSFIQPLLVMVAQPLAFIGGILILWIVHQTFNVYSMIGMLLLVGLVSKNSILLIDLTNRLRKEGKSIKEALWTACPTRMRPVLMTSLAIIAAMLPTAIFTGTGSSMYQPLAWVIIGGMIVSTLLTLVVVPALYSLVEGGIDILYSKK